MRIPIATIVLLGWGLASTGNMRAEENSADAAVQIALLAHQQELDELFVEGDERETAATQISAQQMLTVIWCSLRQEFIASVVDFDTASVVHSYRLGDARELAFALHRVKILRSNFGGAWIAWYQGRKLNLARLDAAGSITHVFWHSLELQDFILCEGSVSELIVVRTDLETVGLTRIRYDVAPHGRAVVLPEKIVSQHAAGPTTLTLVVKNNEACCAWLGYPRDENNKVNFGYCEICLCLLKFSGDETTQSETRDLAPLPVPCFGPAQGKLEVDFNVLGKATIARVNWVPANHLSKPVTQQTKW